MTVKTNLGFNDEAAKADFSPTSTIPRSTIQEAILYLYEWVYARVPVVGLAPADAQYIVSTADATLTAERVLTDTATVSWDNGTASQTKASVVNASIGTAKLTDAGVTTAKIADSNVTTAKIADAAVTMAKLANMTGPGIIGRSANTSGVPAATTGTANQFLQVASTGASMGFATLGGDASLSDGTMTLGSHVVSNAKFRQGVARSVVGVAGNATADVADIQGAADQVLVVNGAGTALSFGAIDLSKTAAVGSSRLALANMVQGVAKSILGVTGASTADRADITGTANQFLQIGSAGTSVAFATMSGDAGLSDGTLTIANNAVSSAKFRQGVARSVVGVTGNATANVADIQGTASQFLGVNSGGTALAFQTLTGDASLSGATLTIANNAVTDAKFRQGAARSVVGVTGNATANTADIQGTADQALVINGAGTALAFGAVDVSKSAAVAGQLRSACFPAMTGAVLSAGATLATTMTTALTVVIGDGTNAITTGVKGFVYCPFAFTIVEWTLIGDASGSIVVDIWSDVYANGRPTVADTITASAKPTMSSVNTNQSSTLTGWTTSVPAGNFLGFNVDSAATVKQVTLTLKITKTG